MKIAVCDDDKYMLKMISTETKRILAQENIPYTLDCFLSPLQFQDAYEKNSYDIVLLDILMPEKDGFQLAEAIQKINPTVNIIFISQQSELVYQSFNYRPFWFICKDEAIKRLPGAMIKCINECREGNVYINIGDDIPVPVKKEDLHYIECIGHKLYIHTKDNIYEKYGSLTAMMQSLSDYGFFRVHKSYIVSMDKVLYVEKDTVRLNNGEKVPISKYKKGLLKELLLKEG